MKKIRRKARVFTMIILILVINVIVILPAASSEYDGWIKSESCLVAVAPIGNSKIIGIIKPKAAVTIEDIGNGWSKVVYAPVRDMKTLKFIDCAGCYIRTDNITTVFPK